MKTSNIALAGNPNSGKTTLFNALTGAKQRVGNWPGVTVERKEGDFIYNGNRFNIIDLPGIYSLSAHSLDEQVSRQYILEEKPDLVINIVDATNLERNLYLTTQLLEMKVPVIIALNMMDLAKQRKLEIDVAELSQLLDCPVLPISASRKTGIEELFDTIAKHIAKQAISKTIVKYDDIVETALQNIEKASQGISTSHTFDSRWLAVKLLENDELAQKVFSGSIPSVVSTEMDKIQKHTGDESDIVIADGRYGFIHGLVSRVLNRDLEISHTITDLIDKFVLHRLLGIPIFLFAMFMMFFITVNIGAPFIDFFDGLCGTIFVDGAKYLFESWQWPAWLSTLLADGIGGGIQTVATFIPPIALIFLCLSVLEDSGYMARAAFVMDRFLRAIGLPGKAFIPMLVGLGCNVPGVMATRTLEDSKDRTLSAIINPFISCGARLPIYTLFVAAFFKNSGGLVLFSIYFTGIVLAILTALLFKKTLFRGEVSTFVMELPPYHIPTFNGVFYHTWTRLRSFTLRAGKVIVLVVLILSFLNSVGTDGSFGNENSDKSVLTKIGKSITPVFHPMGIEKDNWPATVGLFTGLFAKEAVVGTLNSLYNVDKEVAESASEPFDFWAGIKDAFAAIPAGFSDLKGQLLDPIGFGDVTNAATADTDEVAESLEIEPATFVAMRAHFKSATAAYAYLLFILIYAPCLAVIAAIYRETNMKWTVFAVSYLTSLAWLISTMFYQLCTISVNPARSITWLIICGVIISAFYIILNHISTPSQKSELKPRTEP